jgi:hypothetical protein
MYAMIGVGAFSLLACQKSPTIRAAPEPAPSSPIASRSRNLVGIWRIAQFCTLNSAGRRYEIFGSQPSGHFIFDASGLVSIQIHRTPAGAPPPPEAVADSLFTPDERRMFQDGYLGMFGPYTITSDSTFSYHVDGGSLPTYTGTVQTRTYRIVGPERDTLTMGASGCRILLRAG